MLTLILLLPLLISISSFLWGQFVKDDETFPGGFYLHLALVIAQSGVVVINLLFSSLTLATYSLVSIYFFQGIGVVYFLKKKGKVSCGCFGSQSHSTLSWKLALFNFSIGSLSYFIYYQNLHLGILNIGILEGATLSIALLISCLFVTIGIPDGIYAIKGYLSKNKTENYV